MPQDVELSQNAGWISIGGMRLRVSGLKGSLIWRARAVRGQRSLGKCGCRPPDPIEQAQSSIPTRIFWSRLNSDGGSPILGDKEKAGERQERGDEGARYDLPRTEQTIQAIQKMRTPTR
jgi:hypothetical protein